VPNHVPTPAVTAIASAPQNVTRTAATAMRAPPARAAIAPRIARNTSDSAQTSAITRSGGANAVTTSGSAAPAAKLAAEASAAWIGRGFSVSEMPSSSRACAPSASCAIS